MNNGSINGIEISNYKAFETNRSIHYSADLFMIEKKIGSFENKGNGGITDIRVETEDRKKFSELVKNYFLNNPADSQTEEDFIEELITLHEMELMFKEKGKGRVMVETYRYARTTPASERNIQMFDDLVQNIYFLNEESHVKF